MEKLNEDTGFLYAEPSFLSGWAAVLDIGGTLNGYNTSRNGREADERAIASDWAIIGKDIRKAADTFEEKKKVKKQTA